MESNLEALALGFEAWEIREVSATSDDVRAGFASRTGEIVVVDARSGEFLFSATSEI